MYNFPVGIIIDSFKTDTYTAIKTAAELTKNGNIGVIATKTSVKQNYLSDLADRFASDSNVYICGTEHLATAVEKEVTGDELQKLLEYGKIPPCKAPCTGACADKKGVSYEKESAYPIQCPTVYALSQF